MFEYVSQIVLKGQQPAYTNWKCLAAPQGGQHPLFISAPPSPLNTLLSLLSSYSSGASSLPAFHSAVKLNQINKILGLLHPKSFFGMT